MGWSGTGSFTRTNGVNTGAALWQDDADAGTKILDTRHDTHDQDLADGIEACLAKNGENAMTGDLDLDGNKIILDTDGDSYLLELLDDQVQGFTAGIPRFQWDDTGFRVFVDLDVDGNKIILDDDQDSYIQASTDDVAEFHVGATHVLTLSTGAVNVNAKQLIFDTDDDSYIQSSVDDQIDVTIGGLPVARFYNQGLYIADTLGTINRKVYVEEDADTGSVQFHATAGTWTGNVLFLSVDKGDATDFDFLECQSDLNGTPDTEFKFRGDGTATADGSFTGGGAGYAERMEWDDGNPSGEDRVGLTVVNVGKKIRPAQAGESPIGVISVRASHIGDEGALGWHDRYVRDRFGRRQRDPSGRLIQNPAFDPGQPYVTREQRAEWAAVSFVGQEIIRDGQPTDPRWVLLEPREGGVSLWLIR